MTETTQTGEPDAIAALRKSSRFGMTGTTDNGGYFVASITDILNAYDTLRAERNAANARVRELIVELNEANIDRASIREAREAALAHLFTANQRADIASEQRDEAELHCSRATAQREVEQQNVSRLQARVRELEEREAACCPEDVGIDEYIRVLEKKVRAIEGERDSAMVRADAYRQRAQRLANNTNSGARMVQSNIVPDMSDSAINTFIVQGRRKGGLQWEITRCPTMGIAITTAESFIDAELPPDTIHIIDLTTDMDLGCAVYRGDGKSEWEVNTVTMHILLDMAARAAREATNGA